MSMQVPTLWFQIPPSLKSFLRVGNLVARGRETGMNSQDIRDAIQEGLELGFLLNRGPGFAPSPVAEAIIALDHSLQAGRRDKVRVAFETQGRRSPAPNVIHARGFLRRCGVGSWGSLYTRASHG